MNVLIKGHRTEVQPRWKDHILDRIAKLENYEDRIIRLQVTLTSSHHHLKGNELCHIFVKVPRKSIALRRRSETMLMAIDATFKVLEQQMHKLWKDVKTRNRHNKDVRLAKRRGALV
jgi:ribosomal subunit interface protein